MPTPKTEFSSLPPELRDIIWGYTLPPTRLISLDGLRRARFDHLDRSVRRAYELWFRDQQVSEAQRVEPCETTHCFDFRERYPPPVMTQICRESRRFALRAGYFLLPAWDGSGEEACGGGPGAVWFHGTADVLYIEGGSVPFFLTTAPFRIPNAARVRTVAVDWKYVRGGTKTSPEVWDSHSSTMSFRRRLLSLYAYVPGLTTLMLVRPGVQCEYRLSGRRDEERPRGPGELEARLVPLPLSTPIRVSTGEQTWEEMLAKLKVVLDEKPMRRRWEEVYKGSVAFPPEMVGCDISWVKAV